MTTLDADRQKSIGILPYRLTDQALASAIVTHITTAGGSMAKALAISDSILRKFDMLAAWSPTGATLNNHLKHDPIGLDLGDQTVRGIIASNTPGIFTPAETELLFDLLRHASTPTPAQEIT